MQKKTGLAIGFIGFLSLAACTRSDQANAEPLSDSATASSPGAARSAVDPCTFLTKEELQSALGYTFEAGTQTPGEPSCRFASSSGISVTIALPTADVTEAEFNSWRQMAGPSAETLNGVGDAAYFWGSRLYVRVGTRTFTISIADMELTPELRAAVTKLGQTGAAKLE